MKNKIKYLVPSVILLLVLTGSVCSYTSYKFINSIFQGKVETYNKYLKSFKVCTLGYSPVDKILAATQNKTYLVLLQNNREIRPSGGFMGSYAKVEFKEGVLKDWTIQDIYEPDGQIKGHIDPLPPLQQAFQTGDWRLPNSNWDVDFSEAAKDIKWFFEKGGEKNIDGIIALNLGLVQEWLDIVGPLKPYDFPEEITADSFYRTAQSYAEDNFFPGSKMKRNYLIGAGKVLWQETVTGSLIDKLKLGVLFVSQLKQGQVLAWSSDENLQEWISNNGWSGSLGSYKTDYLYPVETNLGANKANCCIERRIEQYVKISSKIENKVFMYWKNNSLIGQNGHDDKWSGDYMNYQRVVLPKEIEIKQIRVGGIVYYLDNSETFENAPDLKEDYTYSEEIIGNFKIVGFWVVVPVQKENFAEVSYSLVPSTAKEYNLVVKRQPGIYELPYKLSVNDRLVTDEVLESDREFKVKIK